MAGLIVMLVMRLLIRILCEADGVCGAISGQSPAMMTCNENKLLPDRQH